MPHDASRFTPTPVFRERRRAQLVKVRLRDARGRFRSAVVRDVSARGVSAVAAGTRLKPGEVITLELPDGTSLTGLVRWVEGAAFGVEFAEQAPATDASRPRLAP